MKVKELVKTAVFATLIFLATAFLKIPLTYGYIHAGDIVLFVSCYFMKPRYSLISAGIGSMFADLMAGFAIYMPVTLVVKAAMALIAGTIMYKNTDVYKLITGYVAASVFMVFGYWVFEGFLYGWMPATLNVPLGLIQPAVGIAVATPLVLFFKKVPQINRFRN
jgi:uncharacterized membrane protein